MSRQSHRKRVLFIDGQSQRIKVLFIIDRTNRYCLRTESVEKWSPDFKSSISFPFKYYKFVQFILLLVALIVWKVRKILSHLMIGTLLFLLQIESSFKLPQRRLPFPLRVEGLRHHRQRTHEPIRVSNVSGLLSEVRIDQSDPNIQFPYFNC